MRVPLTALARIISALGVFALASPVAAQVLGVERDRFTVDGRPKFLLFISYFDGLRRAHANGGAGDLDTDFRYLKQIGVDGIRVLPNWQYDCGSGPTDDSSKLFTGSGAINEPMWPLFLRLLDRAAAHGLIVDVSFTRDTYRTGIPFDAYRQAIVTVAGRLHSGDRYRHVLFDIQNEYPIHGLTVADVHAMLAAVHEVDPARIVTASAGAGEIVHDPEMTVIAYHDSRDADWHEAEVARRQIDAVRKAIAPSVKPVYFQEPMPFRKFHPSCGHGEWPRPGYARLAATRAEQQGAAAWTFHTRQSFDLRDRPLVEILQEDPEQRAELEAIRAGR